MKIKNLFAFIFSTTIAAEAEEKKIVEKTWFTNLNCQSLLIEHLPKAGTRKVEKTLLITDSDAVKSLIRRIEKIPADGPMMKSFGPDVERIKLLFTCADITEEVNIYNKRFKTPSTGFNVGERDVEASLYSDIKTILYPAYAKKILKIKNAPLLFSDFSLTYIGSESKNEDPVTLSTNTEEFLVKGKNDQERKIEVTSGQLPPAPVTFEIGKKKFILRTFETKNNENLLPYYFEVTGD